MGAAATACLTSRNASTTSSASLFCRAASTTCRMVRPLPQVTWCSAACSVRIHVNDYLDARPKPYPIP